MAYVGRHRRTVRSGRTARTSRGRLIVERGHTGTVSIINPAVIRTDLLAGIEARIGTEIWGATVLAMWGTVSAFSVQPTVPLNPWMLYYGAIVSRSEVADLQTNHPNPAFTAGNNDKYSSWMGISAVHGTAPFATANFTGQADDHLRTQSFMWRKRVRINQPEDQLLLAVTGESPLNQTASFTTGFIMNYSIALRLP